jgi:hypothetical protein
MPRAIVHAALLVAAAPAAAEPDRTVGVRVAGAVGAFEEITWCAPEVDFVGTLRVRGGFLAIAAGYASLDNHTFVADGRSFRLGVAGGMRFGRVRAAAALGLEFVAFHADPDVLTEHPGVDILARRGGLLPTAGLELAYPIGASTAIGVFTRVGLRELTLFDTAAGDRGRARLALAGAFIELQIR